MTDRPGYEPVRASTPAHKQPIAKRQRLSERLYLPLIDNALPDMLIVHDLYGRIIEVNNRASASLGYPRAQLLAMRIAGFAPTALFAGSWSEWCSQPSRPAEKG